jgi:5-methylcytosine-specific restriction endonuclease McrA
MASEPIPEMRPIVTRAEAKALGLTRFFTGKPCLHGHISERTVSSKGCLACQKVIRDRNPEYSKSYYRANADRLKAAQIARNRANPGRAAEYYAKNQEKAKAYAADWRRANPERLKATQDANRSIRAPKDAARYVANREQMLAARAAWKVANKEARRAHDRTRRAKKRCAEGKHTGADIKALFSIQKGKCAHSWCRSTLRYGYHVDHITALSRGGSNDRKNIQLLCPPCNQRKHAKHPIDFAQQNGMLL